MGRSEAGSLLAAELYILWCMVHPGRDTICFVSFLTKRLLSHRSTSAITIGGMISILVERCAGQVLPPKPSAFPAFLMDPRCLRKYRILGSQSNRPPFRYQVGGKFWCVLPQQRISTAPFPRSDAAWYLPPDSTITAFPDALIDDGRRGDYMPTRPQSPPRPDEPSHPPHQAGPYAYQQPQPDYSTIQASIESLGTRMAELNTHVDARFDAWGNEFHTFRDSVNTRFDSLETRIDVHFADLFHMLNPDHTAPRWPPPPPQ